MRIVAVTGICALVMVIAVLLAGVFVPAKPRPRPPEAWVEFELIANNRTQLVRIPVKGIGGAPFTLTTISNNSAEPVLLHNLHVTSKP